MLKNYKVYLPIIIVLLLISISGCHVTTTLLEDNGQSENGQSTNGGLLTYVRRLPDAHRLPEMGPLHDGTAYSPSWQAF